MTTLTKCPICGYPIQAHVVGETTACSYCGEHLISQGVTIPTSIFVGALFFGLGMLLGPALVATTDSGKRWLVKQASKIGG